VEVAEGGVDLLKGSWQERNAKGFGDGIFLFDLKAAGGGSRGCWQPWGFFYVYEPGLDGGGGLHPD